MTDNILEYIAWWLRIKKMIIWWIILKILWDDGLQLIKYCCYVWCLVM